MTLYLLTALVFAVSLWLVFSLGRVALRAMAARKERLETARQAVSRVLDAEHEPGRNPDHPIPIQTPSVVEASASEYGCPMCGAEMRVGAHRAMEHNGRRLRVAGLKCKGCDYRMDIYYEIKQAN